MSICILCRKSRWSPKVAGKRFLIKVASRLYIHPVGQKFCRNCSISHRFQDKCITVSSRNSRWQPKVAGKFEANLCFSIFGKHLKIHFWGEEIFLKLPIVHWLDTLWVENFKEITLSLTVKAIEANLCFSIFGKNSKFQNGRHFWREKNWQEYIA